MFILHYIRLNLVTFISYIWPFEDSHYADMALSENEFDTPDLIQLHMSPPGTPNADTVCQVCPNGTYSNMVSDQQSCMQHQNCEAAGMLLVLNGSTWHDSVCTSCEELRSKGKITSLLRKVRRFM